MLNRPTFISAAVGIRQPVGVDPTMTQVANYLLCIESFTPDAIFNCEDQDLRPAQPSRGALAECVGDNASIQDSPLGNCVSR